MGMDCFHADIEVTILVSHIDFDLGIGTIFQQLTGADIMLLWHCFLLSVALISDHQLVYRAICIVALQSLVFITVAYVASLLKFPAETLYVSPFRVAGSNPVCTACSSTTWKIGSDVVFAPGSCLGTDMSTSSSHIKNLTKMAVD